MRYHVSNLQPQESHRPVELSIHPLGDILVVDDDPVVRTVLENMLVKLGYHVATARNASDALNQLTRHVPDVIVSDIVMPGVDGLQFCRQIRQHPQTAVVPIILISTRSTFQERMEGFEAGADEYLTKPFNLVEVQTRLAQLVSRNRRALACNPLTRLPGNPSIEAEVNQRLSLRKPFAFAYIDVDAFKAYNDVYGYQAGDRAIQALAYLLVEASQSDSPPAFVGHIGGDDFVLIGSPARMPALLKDVLERFDQMVKGFYSPEDRLRKGVITLNRQHVQQYFPLMRLSCAVIDTDIRDIQHYGELVEIASELKHHLKSQRNRRASGMIWNWRGQRKPHEASHPSH